MIQRIQSLYLLLTTILSFLFCKGSFLTFISKTGDPLKITFEGLLKVTSANQPETIEKIILFPVMVIIIAVFSAIIIFLYKNRKLQLFLVKLLTALIVLSIIAVSIISYTLIIRYNAEFVPGFKMAIPVIQLLLVIMAWRGIKKDDDLVKSYDRLR